MLRATPGTSDTTLAAMLWEEGLAPADAAERWGTSSVTRRIKRLYANRLGGNWDLEGTGPRPRRGSPLTRAISLNAIAVQ